MIRPRCVLSGLSVFTVTATINDVRARLGTLEPALEAFQAWRLGIDCTARENGFDRQRRSSEFKGLSRKERYRALVT